MQANNSGSKHSLWEEDTPRRVRRMLLLMMEEQQTYLILMEKLDVAGFLL